MFFTVQKSNEAKTTTTMNVSMSEPKNAFRNMNENSAAPLNPMWNMHATGLFAVEKSPSVKLARDANWSLDIEVGLSLSVLNGIPSIDDMLLIKLSLTFCLFSV